MSIIVAEKHKSANTVLHLEDVEMPPTPNNISHTLRELDLQEKEKKKRGGPIEELESIKLDDQHLEPAVQVGSQLPGAFGTSSSTSSKSIKTSSPGRMRTYLELTLQS